MHAEAEKEFVNPENCPADTTIQVFHMEAGEHVLEFESEHDEDFNMAVLKMLGGHAHHHTTVMAQGHSSGQGSSVSTMILTHGQWRKSMVPMLTQVCE